MGKTDQFEIQEPIKKPRRRWRRRVIWVVVLVPIVLLGCVLVIGQTRIMRMIVEPILADQLGVDVSTGSVHLMPTGEIVINDALCSSDSIGTKAGSLIEIDRAVISMNWWGVLKGSGQVRSIVIDKPIVRVSQDIDTGVLNLSAFTLKQGSGGGAMPAIEIRSGILQIGEHDQTHYRVLKELSIKGQISEQTPSGVSGFEFEALGIEPSVSGSVGALPGSFAMTGQISSDGIDGVLNGVRLEDWPAEIVPSRSRAIYKRLALAGDLAPTRFHVTNDGLAEVILTLEGVALNLPIEESSTDDGSPNDEPLRMKQTRGVIKFGSNGLSGDLRGVIDNLEYTVKLDYRGLESDSPFDSTMVTDFRLDDGFKPARFLPTKIIAKLDKFEHPKGDIHAVVRISRGDDPNDRSIQVSGRADITNGSAIYKKFRYPFHDLHGMIDFDTNRLEIHDIRGVGPTGATLVANGVFSPLGKDSVANLTIEAQNVPIDQHLESALNPAQQKLVATLFNKEKFAKILDAGLVQTKESAEALGEARRVIWDRLDALNRAAPTTENAREKARLAAELSSADRRLAMPIFGFGGTTNVEVHLTRHPDRTGARRWSNEIHVNLPSVGLVPKHFPLPIVAEDVNISITKQRVTLSGGQYHGLMGGDAWVDVSIDMTQEEIKPIIKIKARDFPIDQRLIGAIPGYMDPQSEDPDDISLRRILDRLNLVGAMECDAIIGPRSDGHLGYDVEATVLRGSAHPDMLDKTDSDLLSPEHASLSLDQLYGTVYITEELIIVDLDGMLSSPQRPLAPTPISVLTQLTLPDKSRGVTGEHRINGLLPDDYGPPTPGARLYASAHGDGIDLAMPLQDAIAVVSPRLARDLLKKKERYQLDGVIGMDATLEGFIGGAIRSTLALNQIQHLSFDYADTRYRIGSSYGRAQLVLDSEPSVSFDGFRIPIEADNADAGSLSLDGSLPLARAGRYIEITEPSSLKIDYNNAGFDSPLTRAVLDRFSNTSSGGWLETHEIGGVFDLAVVLSPKIGGGKIRGAGDTITAVPTLIHGSLRPSSLSLKMDDQIARFDEVSGEIRFDGFEGTINDIRASDDSTSLGINGRWSMNPGEGLGLDLSINAQGDLLAGPVRAIMPDAIDRVIDRLEIHSQSPVSIDDLRIKASGLGRVHSSYRITGSAELEGGSATVGLPLTELSGDLDFEVRGDADTLSYEILVDASRLRAGLMRVYDAQIKIIGDASRDGVVLIPEIRASMHGGQIAGSAQIRPGAGGEPNYWIEMHASGVRAAPVFDDLLLPPEGLVGPPRPGKETVLSAWNRGEDLSRGALIGDLTLTGPVGDPSKRSGRGIVQIAGGSVLEMPGLLNLIEVSNLSLPAGSPLDFAEAEFYVDGPTLAFERLSASSKRIEILGYGTVDWDTREVDLRFRSRSLNPIPILSGLIEQLRDELITTRISGTIGNTTKSVQQFGATKRLIDAMLGKPVSDHQRRLREVEEQVQARHKRTMRTSGDLVHLPSTHDGPLWDWDMPGDENP